MSYKHQTWFTLDTQSPSDRPCAMDLKVVAYSGSVYSFWYVGLCFPQSLIAPKKSESLVHLPSFSLERFEAAIFANSSTFLLLFTPVGNRNHLEAAWVYR